METLSVIIPVYNCRDYLEACVASLSAVNSDRGAARICEILLVDDGSTDGSSLLCDRLAAERDAASCPIRVIHQRNGGVSAARNRGLREARGTFVLFVDSDDTVDPQKLAACMEALAGDPTADMAVFGISFDYYAGNRIYRQEQMLPPLDGTSTPENCKAMLERLFFANMLSPLWNKLIRRSLLQDAGICLREDMTVYEDLEFSLHAMACCRSLRFCQEPVYRYRQAPDEGNAGRRLKRIARLSEIVDRIEDALLPLGASEEILLTLYHALARGKVSEASKEEVTLLCSEYREWIDRHGLAQKIAGNQQAMLYYNGNVSRLLRQRRKTKIRHKLANWVKRIVGDFRKW